jgi:hypothetical protein
MSEFLKSNPKLDEVIGSATTVAELRETMLTELAAQGVVSRDRTDQFDIRVLPQAPQPPTPDVSLPANNEMQRCSDVFIRVVYPSGNNKFEIYASSEVELDERERQIRAMFAR